MAEVECGPCEKNILKGNKKKDFIKMGQNEKKIIRREQYKKNLLKRNKPFV